LTSRLETIASLVTKGSKVADIGTDHGYIPVHLLKNNIVPFAILADINKGPLDNGKRFVKWNNLLDKVDFRLGSGIDVLHQGEVDEVIIAGMGGILISDILENKKEVAKKVGIGAVVFAYLKNSRERDIIFDWDEMLSFEGETGPYVQYTYARGKSILRKLGEGTGEVDYGKLISEEEFELVKTLSGFNNSIKQALDKLQPSIVTRFTIDVAKAFNKFYNSINISNSEDEVTKNTRLALVKATLQVIESGLHLIGLETVDEM